MSEEVHVRVATPEDLEGCMSLFVQANDENGIERMAPEKLLNIVWPSLHQDGGIVGVIGEPGTEPQGVVLLRVETLWYSDSPVISEKLIFVHHNYRSAKGGRAGKLCDFCKKVADELEMPLIVGVISNERTKGKVKMFERHLGEPIGAYFLYNGSIGVRTDPLDRAK